MTKTAPHPSPRTVHIDDICDWGMVYSFCAIVFVLPASIALIDIFAALAVVFYLVKKINHIVPRWPLSPVGVWKELCPKDNVLNQPILFLSLAMVISTVFSQYPKLSLLAFFGKFVKYIFVYFSFIEAFKDEKRIRIFLAFFLVAAFITVLSGVGQHYTGKDFLKGHTSNGRVNSMFYTANGLAAYLLPVIALVINLLYTAFFKKKSFVLGGALFILLGLVLACFCWSYSRSAFLGYLVSLFLIVLLDWRKVFMVGVLSLIFIAIFLPSLNHARNIYLINDNNAGSRKPESFINAMRPDVGGVGSGRTVYWEKALSIIKSSPIWGTGPNTYFKIVKKDPDRRTWWYAHNCYLQLTAETGFLGLSAFLWMLFVLLRQAWGYCWRMNDPWPQAMLQGSFSGLVGFLFQSSFDNTFYTVQLGMLMWLMIALVMSLTRLNEQ